MEAVLGSMAFEAEHADDADTASLWETFTGAMRDPDWVLLGAELLAIGVVAAPLTGVPELQGFLDWPTRFIVLGTVGVFALSRGGTVWEATGGMIRETSGIALGDWLHEMVDRAADDVRAAIGWELPEPDIAEERRTEWSVDDEAFHDAVVEQFGERVWTRYGAAAELKDVLVREIEARDRSFREELDALVTAEQELSRFKEAVVNEEQGDAILHFKQALARIRWVRRRVGTGRRI